MTDVDLIDLNDYGNVAKELLRFRVDVGKRLENVIFSIYDIPELTSRSLQAIQQTTNLHDLVEEERILIVLRHFGLERVINRESKFSGRPSNIPFDDKSVVGLYINFVLGFESLPTHWLDTIKPKVENDLREINRRIVTFEQDEIIKKYRHSEPYSRNHSSKTKIDFYIRLLNERQVILDYFLEGIYDRCLERSITKLSVLPLESLAFFRDYPYQFNNYFKLINFDYENIDRLTHRVDFATVSEMTQWRDLYNKDKNKFYEELFQIRDIEAYISSIQFYAASTPQSEPRLKVFDKIIELFRNKNWLPFYALALPQVEGLFSEINQILFPEKKGVLFKSLSDKVQALRTDNDFDVLFFDYCQYHLPVERNKFMHYGLTDDYELKSYDLLLDLEYLLRFIYELDNPYVLVTRLIKGRNPENFVDYEEFVTLFKSIDSLHTEQRETIETELSDFMSNFIASETDIEFIAKSALSRVSEALAAFDEKLESFVSQYNAIPSGRSLLEKPMKYFNTVDKVESDFMEFAKLNGDVIISIIRVNQFFEGIMNHIAPKYYSTNLKNVNEAYSVIRPHIKKVSRCIDKCRISEETLTTYL